MDADSKARRRAVAKQPERAALDAELARKILLEFEMIELHGHSSDHINEIEEQLRKIADGE